MNDELLFWSVGVATTLALLFGVIYLVGRNPPAKISDSDKFRRMIPYCEALVTPRLPEGWQAVFPHAAEVFFPPATHANPIFEIEIVGACRYHYCGSSIERADALYRTRDGRFTVEHFGLLINNRPLYHFTGGRNKVRQLVHVIEADREAHRYRLLFEGERVAIAFETAYERWVHPDLGYLRARVTLLPEETPSPGLKKQQERERIEARAAAIEGAERFADAVRALSVRAILYRNWRDPQFQSKFARAHTDEIIQTQSEIRKEALQLLSQHHRLQYLRRHNPDVVATLLGRLETLHMAERVDLDRRLALQAAPAPTQKAIQAEPAKPKITADGVRQLKLWRQQRDMEDKLALVKDKIAREQQTKAWVMSEYPNLDEDEHNHMYQQVLEHLYDDNRDGTVL